MKIPNIAIELDNGERFVMWLADFLDVNRDGIEEDEAALIITAIERGEEYRGGGGAAAEWTVRRAAEQKAA